MVFFCCNCKIIIPQFANNKLLFQYWFFGKIGGTLCHKQSFFYTYIIQQQQKNVCKTEQSAKSLLTLWTHTIYAESVSLFSNCERRKFDKWRRVGGHLPASYHLVWRGAVAYLCHKVFLRPAIIK